MGQYGWPSLATAGLLVFQPTASKHWRHYTHRHTTVLRLFGFCPGQPGWAGSRRNIHPLTLIVVINHPYLLPPSTTIHGILPIQSTYFTVFFKSLSIFYLVYLLAWHPPFHTPYISLLKTLLSVNLNTHKLAGFIKASVTWHQIFVFTSYLYHIARVSSEE